MNKPVIGRAFAFLKQDLFDGTLTIEEIKQECDMTIERGSLRECLLLSYLC